MSNTSYIRRSKYVYLINFARRYLTVGQINDLREETNFCTAIELASWLDDIYTDWNPIKFGLDADRLPYSNESLLAADTVAQMMLECQASRIENAVKQKYAEIAAIEAEEGE